MHEEEELEDYFAQFDEVPKFDSEECPTCGLNFSSGEASGSSDKIQIAQCSFMVKAEEIKNILINSGIDAEIRAIDKVYAVFISSKHLEKSKELLM